MVQWKGITPPPMTPVRGFQPALSLAALQHGQGSMHSPIPCSHMHIFILPAAYGKLEECEVSLTIHTSQLYCLANLYQAIAFGFKFG